MTGTSDAGTRSRTLLPELARIPGHVLWRASARVELVLAQTLPEGVDVHGHAVLLALDHQRTSSQQQLADRVGVSRTTMTRVAAALADQGLVERVRNPADRRSFALTRTHAGAGAVRTWGTYVAQAEQHLAAPFSATAAAELHGSLLAAARPALSTQTPEPLLTSTGFLVTRLHARAHTVVMEALRDLDLEPRHLGSLAALSSRGPVAQADLARYLGVSGPTVVEIVDHLERRGLVERRRLDTDRRTQALHLLPGAEQLATDARHRGTVATRTVLAPLSSAGQERLTALLVRLVTGG